MPSASGWGWFGAWAVAGALATFSFLALASIGVFVLPAAALALFVVSQRSPRLPAFGLISGAGLVLLAISWLHWGEVPCPANGSFSSGPGQVSVECGGMDALPWLVAGLVLLFSGALAYVAVQLRNQRIALG
jgi:hypothetical protein